MLDIKEDIKIYDDTGNGDDFNVTEIFYNDDKVIVCDVSNDWYEYPFRVMIYLSDNEVVSDELQYYYAINI